MLMFTYSCDLLFYIYSQNVFDVTFDELTTLLTLQNLAKYISLIRAVNFVNLAIRLIVKNAIESQTS